ncbi:hypothetical protein JVT61DRAFT_12344 [Boletus reticuloceps]|uniref:Uncharacterized protein n=1 Tax=Boletus reticuloceps TaxID=495285 RepID=A0A8I2YE74_9AGAM|nr:hypothetical protein JVT61DRAFT_12344 [Boletus reticuloceps]
MTELGHILCWRRTFAWDRLGSPYRHIQYTTTMGRDSRLTGAPRGVLAPWLDYAFPHSLDPTRKTFVWGAPPIDDGSTE